MIRKRPRNQTCGHSVRRTGSEWYRPSPRAPEVISQSLQSGNIFPLERRLFQSPRPSKSKENAKKINSEIQEISQRISEEDSSSNAAGPSSIARFRKRGSHYVPNILRVNQINIFLLNSRVKYYSEVLVELINSGAVDFLCFVHKIAFFKMRIQNEKRHWPVQPTTG